MQPDFSKEEREYNRLLDIYRTTIESKMDPEDLKVMNEVIFSAHSCGIEGNSYSVDDSFALKELELGYVPKDKPLVETMEMLDHFHAYEYMASTLSEPLTEEYIKKLHYILTEHTITYRHHDTKPGEYTKTDMGAGDTVFGDHEELIKKVPRLLDSTNRTIGERKLPVMFIAAMFHGFFIYLHPFRDGNGRLGRLLSSKILMQAGHPPVIIKKEDREGYIKALKLFRKESEEYLVHYFYMTATNRLKEIIESKETKNMKFSFPHKRRKGLSI